MAHFHDHNPWATRLAYVPDVEEWLDCLHPFENAAHFEEHKAWYRKQFIHFSHPLRGGKFDLYVFRSGEMGCRYGKEPSQYLSPYADKAKAKALWHKYTPAPRQVALNNHNHAR